MLTPAFLLQISTNVKHYLAEMEEPVLTKLTLIPVFVLQDSTARIVKIVSSMQTYHSDTMSSLSQTVI